ncbi:hypothetical protein BDZ45DRAFT_598508 [Acephala macrosclerotiorum]|nr:hypothetical protein BDZ45DRAFT_598508 [Acephala macrosclerotiorum]
MAYPKVVAFDLDGTIWSNWLDPNEIGRRGWVGTALEDNLGIDGNEIRDMWNPSQRVRVSGDIWWILDDLISHGVKIAIASRNSNRDLCNRAMWLIRVQIPWGSNDKPFTDLLSYNEIYDTSKQFHFQQISTYSGAGYHEMLLFDDQAHSNDVEMWQGVTFHKVSDGNRGVTGADYSAGLDTWRRNQYIRCPLPSAGLNPHPNMKQIGWVGTDWATGELYRQGKRRPKSDRPSRWGWGLYVADDPAVAAQFAKWRREHEPDNHYICKVFVWIPEDGSIRKTNIDHESRHIAEVQIRRDDIIASSFGVRKPYILFSRHHWMDLLAMTWRRNHVGRFSEMVLYPQVQDALFYSEPWKLSDAQPWIDSGLLEGFDFRHKLAEWNIQRNWETEQDFKNHNEDFY